MFFSLEVFTFPDYFSMPPALHPGFSGPLRPPPALSSTLATFGCFAFARLFRHSFTTSATVLSGHFLRTGAFLPCSPSLHFWHVLWLRCGIWQKHPIQDAPLCLPSQSCPFRLTHGLWICSSMQTINSVPFPRLPKDSFSSIGVYQLPLFHWPDEKGDLCFSRQWEFLKFDFHHNNLTKNT